MKLLGQRYVLEALELAAPSGRHSAIAAGPDDDALSARPSREEIAAAWRRWGERDEEAAADATSGAETGRRRGLGLPAPRTGI